MEIHQTTLMLAYQSLFLNHASISNIILLPMVCMYKLYISIVVQYYTILNTQHML